VLSGKVLSCLIPKAQPEIQITGWALLCLKHLPDMQKNLGNTFLLEKQA